MKIFAYLFAALSLATSVAQAQVPVVVSPRNFKINNLLPSVTTSPKYTVQNTTDKRSEYLKWFEIEVEFDVDGVELVDEITVEYLVSINGKLCPGRVTHVNVPKGKNHYSVMYISPRNLDRLTGGKQLNNAMVDNIWVTISKQGQKLAEKAMVPKAVPNLPRIENMLSTKSDTPFAALWWDRYEAVKPEAR